MVALTDFTDLTLRRPSPASGRARRSSFRSDHRLAGAVLAFVLAGALAPCGHAQDQAQIPVQDQVSTPAAPRDQAPIPTQGQVASGASAPGQDQGPTAAPAIPQTPAPAPASPPDQTAPPQPSPATASAPPPVQTPVQVQSLARLDLFSTGREAGLGQDLWKGSSADIARVVIPTLAVRPLSPAGVALARRLLAQAATAPDGAGSDANLAAARARALLALGEAPLADTILDHTPGLADNAALSQTAAEAALIIGQETKACAIGDALGQGRDAAYWLHLRAYCQLIAGKTDAAQLTFTLAMQQGKDAVFARLMGAAVNGVGDPGPASLRNGLDFALSRRLKLDLTPALASAPLAIAAQIAATNAAAQSAAPAAAPPSLSEPQVIAPLKAAGTFAAFVTAANTAQPSIAALVQAKSPMTEPVLEASAALAAGDVASAQAIRGGMTQDSIPGATPLDLALLDAALSAAAGKADSATLDRLSERGGAGDARSRARAQAATAIFAALGGAMSDTARAEFVGFELGRGEASAARLLGLEAAVDGGRTGETALLALWMAQSGGAAGPAAADRAQIIRALNRVGLKADAQAFAVEGLLSLQSR